MKIIAKMRKKPTNVSNSLTGIMHVYICSQTHRHAGTHMHTPLKGELNTDVEVLEARKIDLSKFDMGQILGSKCLKIACVLGCQSCCRAWKLNVWSDSTEELL